METLKPGFVWTFEELKDGVFVPFETQVNLIPTEGLNYILDTAFKSGTQQPNFYVGLYEGNYTPIPADTMATFPTAATELTAYVSATRPVATLGTVANGSVDNLASPAEFVGTTDGKSIRGGFISTTSAKGGGTGPLLSAVKLSTARPFDNGTTFRAKVAFQFVSV